MAIANVCGGQVNIYDNCLIRNGNKNGSFNVI